MNLKKTATAVICCILSTVILGGCGGTAPASSGQQGGNTSARTADTAKTLPERFASFQPYAAEAPGTAEERNEKAFIDSSNACCGYVTASYTAGTDRTLKVQVCGGGITYTYCLLPGESEVFPLTEGSGEYSVTVYENVSDGKYAAVISSQFTAEIKNENEVFLYPNCYVNFSRDSAVAAKARELLEGCGSELDVVESIYSFIIYNFTYDKDLASTVASDYMPDPDAFLEKKTGICLDYAACMTALLRCTGIPCKLVTGYSGEAYHAWISVYTEENGWIDNIICFNGNAWTLMDPTLAASGSNAKSLKEYIGDGNNYTVKFCY